MCKVPAEEREREKVTKRVGYYKPRGEEKVTGTYCTGEILSTYMHGELSVGVLEDQSFLHLLVGDLKIIQLRLVTDNGLLLCFESLQVILEQTKEE